MKSNLSKHATATFLFLFLTVGLLFLPAPVSFAQIVSFGPATNFAVGSEPQAVAVGDFNGDGKLDLAVANSGFPGSANVSILLGKGDGTFEAAMNFDVASFPASVAVGDFNGDGKLDLAVANNRSANVLILLGKGDGTFEAAMNFDVGPFPESVAVGDFNGDGKLDLAVANLNSGISILLGRGDGTFGTATNFAAGVGPISVAAGDFNKDGKLDLAVANLNSGISILLGRGDGTFGTATNFAAGVNPVSVAIGDFNGDGKLDLAVANSSFPDNNISILLGNGDGTFGAATNFATGIRPNSVAVGDFNGDGKLDLAVANRGLGPGNGSFSVLLGRGDGTFGTATDFVAGGNPFSVALGDFNGDGKLDLAVVNGGSNNVSILLNTTAFSPAVNFGSATNFAVGNGPHFVAVADFNRDGKLDLAVANFSGDDVSILFGAGDGTFGAATNFAVGSSPTSVAVGDFNRDGKLDLAVANLNSGNVSILLGNGDGTFSAATNFTVGTTPESVAVGDFNGDGKLDLAVANLNSGNVSILLGNGDGTFAATTNFAAGTEPTSVAVGDFNHDGKFDLAVANSGGDDVSILLGNGDGTFAAATNFAAGTEPTSVAVGDFNHDGKFDLAVANSGGDDVSILLGNGDGTFGAAANFAVGPGPVSVAVGDFNLDGKLDLAVANHGSSNVSILLGDGTGSFGTATDFAAGTASDSVAVGDFNGDGKLDLAVANFSSNNISILTSPSFTLTVSKDGTGSGIVTSNTAGINCGGDCTETYVSGTFVTLTATADPGFLFDGWSGGGCTGRGTCTVIMNADTTVTATFVTPLALAALALPNGEVGVPYSAPLISGGLEPYGITLTKGVFPAGLSGNSANGRLVGTPATSSKRVSFTVKVTDQNFFPVTGTFKITILTALSISTKSLKAGTHGKAYKGALAATGGKKPYGWSLLSGSLPTGLTLNSSSGALTGTPTQTGSFNPTFKVTDPAGGSAQKLLPLTIK